MPGEIESGYKWWIRYIVVPIIGASIAIIVALLIRNPSGSNANNISTPTSIPSATAIDAPSTPATSATPPAVEKMHAPPVSSPDIPKGSPTPPMETESEAGFRQLLRDAGESLRVGQYGSACRIYLKAANRIPAKFNNQVKWNLIAQAKDYFRENEFNSCGKSFREAFQDIKVH